METPKTTVTQGRRIAWLIGSIAMAGSCIVVGAVLHLGLLSPSRAEAVSNTVYPFLSVGAGALLGAAAFTMRGRSRWAWAAIGLGVFFWGAGESVWAWYSFVLEVEVPYPGWADVFYVAGYPTVLVGVFLLPHVKTGRFERLRILLDAAAGTIAIAALSWVTFLRDNLYLDPEAGLLEQSINILYPVGDVIILIAVIILTVRRSEYQFDGRLLAVGIGLVLTAAADVIYLFEYETYVDGMWLDGIWLYSYGAFAVAAYLITRSVRLVDQAYRPARIWQLAVPYAAILALWAVTLFENRSSAGVLQVSASLVVLLVIGRQAVAIRENRELVERQRDDLVASVSHELRTPLTSIQGFAQLLDQHWDGLPDEQKHELIATINSQARHLGNITTDLVEVTRDRLHATDLEISETDLSRVVDDAVGMLGETSDGRIQIQVEVPDGLKAFADRSRLTQVLVNLLTNGCRYGRSRIDVVAAEAEGKVLVQVHDDGPGIPRKYEAAIWERFERGAHRFDTVTPGSGIGLPIAKALIEAHGGWIHHTRSNRLGGACFEIELPVHRVAVAARS